MKAFDLILIKVQNRYFFEVDEVCDTGASFLRGVEVTVVVL